MWHRGLSGGAIRHIVSALRLLADRTQRARKRRDLRGQVSVSDRERPLVTGVNGPLMARRSQNAEPRTRGLRDGFNRLWTIT